MGDAAGATLTLSTAEASDDASATWIDAIAARRDLALRPPRGATGMEGPAALVATLAAEFAEYRAVVADARGAARRNAEQLAAVVASTGAQGALARETATAVAEAGSGAAHVAEAAEALRSLAAEAAGAAEGSLGALSGIGATLGTLGGLLAEGIAPLERVTGAAGGVAAFIATLERLSHQAQLLSVNAAIEAAHLGEGGARFRIVADEVRKLSGSTRESAREVARIAAALDGATGQVGAATTAATEATEAARREIDAAASTLAQTRASIAELGETIAGIAAVSGEQSRALESVIAAVELIARHADEAVGASRDAARLDLDSLLASAGEAAGRWNVSASEVIVLLDEDEVRSLCTGEGALAAALRTLVERVDADQRAVIADVVRAAVAVSHNGLAWKSIGGSLVALRREIDPVRTAVEESAQGARTAAQLAAALRTLVTALQRRYDEAVASLESALERVVAVARGTAQIDGLVDAMSAAAGHGDEILALIETLSSETDLLSLNAAIEAAHAGELGRGFGVIAEEIRRLALATHASTASVSALVAEVADGSTIVRGAFAAAAESADAVTASAAQVRETIASLRGSLDETIRRALDVSATAEQQARALERVLENIDRTAAAVDADAAVATNERRAELTALGTRAQAIAARRSVAVATAQVRRLCERVVERIEACFEAAIALGAVSDAAMTDFAYTELRGERVRELARLFNVSRVPPSGFTPPKFVTAWDAAIDEEVIAILDAAFDEAAFARPIVIGACDLNGFVYGQPRRMIADWTGDLVRDRLQNRIKFFIEDDDGLRATRLGLGPAAERVGRRAAYEAFRSAGCTLEQPSGARPWGAYVVTRDTGEIFNVIVTAVYVRGRRHGSLRFAYDADVT